MAPAGDLACNPGMCSDWESNWRAFGSQSVLNPLSYTSQDSFLIKTEYYSIVCSSFHQLRDIWVVSPLGLWSLMLLRTFVYKFLCKRVFNSPECTPRIRVAESYGNSTLNLLRNWRTVLQSGRNILHSYQQHMRVLIYSCPCQHWLLFTFFLVAVKWNLIMVLICISLMIYVEHILMCFFKNIFYGLCYFSFPIFFSLLLRSAL